MDSIWLVSARVRVQRVILPIDFRGRAIRIEKNSEVKCPKFANQLEPKRLGIFQNPLKLISIDGIWLASAGVGIGGASFESRNRQSNNVPSRFQIRISVLAMCFFPLKSAAIYFVSHFSDEKQLF